MQINISNNVFITLPANWTSDKSDNVVSVFKVDSGFGALQFSTFQINIGKSIDLKAELADLADIPITSIIIKDNCAKGDWLNEKENRCWQYWLLLKENILFFVTYNCGFEDMGKEDTVIEKIIKSLGPSAFA